MKKCPFCIFQMLPSVYKINPGEPRPYKKKTYLTKKGVYTAKGEGTIYMAFFSFISVVQILDLCWKKSHEYSLLSLLSPPGLPIPMTLLSATIALNLSHRVLKNIFSLEMVKNAICLRGASKQNALFQRMCPPKNVPMPPMSRIGPAC